MLCQSKSSAEWQRDQPVHLQHIVTSQFLVTSRAAQFNHGAPPFRCPIVMVSLTHLLVFCCATSGNCPNCPIVNQQETSATRGSEGRSDLLWQTDEGIYFQPEVVGQTSGSGKAGDQAHHSHGHGHGHQDDDEL